MKKPDLWKFIYASTVRDSLDGYTPSDYWFMAHMAFECSSLRASPVKFAKEDMKTWRGR